MNTNFEFFNNNEFLLSYQKKVDNVEEPTLYITMGDDGSGNAQNLHIPSIFISENSGSII